MNITIDTMTVLQLAQLCALGWLIWRDVQRARAAAVAERAVVATRRAMPGATAANRELTAAGDRPGRALLRQIIDAKVRAKLATAQQAAAAPAAPEQG